MLGIVFVAQGCQTSTELTDADKDAMVQAVKQSSQEYWSILSDTYDNETYNRSIKFIDENSDKMWQTEPVAVIFNVNIINKQADSFATLESMIENRISSPVNMQKAHYSVLSDNKVLEVLEGDYSVIMKDSTESGPYAFVVTVIWANVDGDWKMQFNHNSYALRSE